MDKKELIIKCIKRLFSNSFITICTCFIIFYIISLPFKDTSELINKIHRSHFFSPASLAIYSFFMIFEIIITILRSISKETKETIKFILFFILNIGLLFVISYGLGKLLLLYFPLSKDLISFIPLLCTSVLIIGTGLYITQKNNAKFGILFFEDRFSDVNRDHSMQRLDDIHTEELVLKISYLLLSIIIGTPLLFGIMQVHVQQAILKHLKS